ncbi:MAG: beta-ketoacyl-ACP synthase [Desulfovibrionaceae bacterium]|nr:beta-ketoacyl-ACP synthase [Desulfovibrionaceae bacterium]
MRRRVAVTGGGLVSALGSSWTEALEGLRRGANKVRRMEEWDRFPYMNTRLAAPVDFTPPDLPRKKMRGMGRVAQLALAATDQALRMAGLESSPELDQGCCGVAYGSSAGSVDAMVALYSMLLNGDSREIDATTYLRSMPQTCAANIEVFYGLTGRVITCNTACTSGSMAIGYACESIREGKQEIMIAGGAEELSPADAAVFDTLFAASSRNDIPELTPRAYDLRRDGLVVGEGAGTLILEEYERALDRGAEIYAELVGFGTNADGKHLTQPNRSTMGRVMLLALEDAGLEPGSIGYVSAHGTATKSGDIAESQAVYDVFKRAVPMSTLKNYLGHTLGACGAIEAWVLVNMLREGWFHPNINLSDLDPECAPLDYLTGAGRHLQTEYVMSNNFAFGGINTSLIFRKAM